MLTLGQIPSKGLRIYGQSEAADALFAPGRDQEDSGRDGFPQVAYPRGKGKRKLVYQVPASIFIFRKNASEFENRHSKARGES